MPRSKSSPISHIRRCWRDHSLTIVVAILGAICVGCAFQDEPGTKWWDVWLGSGQGLLTVAAFYLFAGWLRERNRPED